LGKAELQHLLEAYSVEPWVKTSGFIPEEDYNNYFNAFNHLLEGVRRTMEVEEILEINRQ
jgi:hypothetical protein